MYSEFEYAIQQTYSILLVIRIKIPYLIISKIHGITCILKMENPRFASFTQAKVVSLASYVNSVYLNFIFPFLPRMIVDF